MLHAQLKVPTTLQFLLLITQYGSTRNNPGSFGPISTFLRTHGMGATAKCGCEEQKEHYSSTKRKLGYTLIPAMYVCLHGVRKRCEQVQRP